MIMKLYVSKQEGNIFIFSYHELNDFFSHRLEVPKRLNVNDNDLLRLAIFSNPFDDNLIEVHGLKANEKIIAELSHISGKNILCDSYSREEFTQIESLKDQEIFLGFSGGFDSMAANAILPKSTKISIDFGGDFAREALFFRKLDTNIVNWDLRNKRTNSLPKFNEGKNWRFMLAPLTLFRENKPNMVIATGTIMEASPYWMQTGNKGESKYYGHAGYGSGISFLNPIAGLTEVTTTLIVNKFYERNVVKDSLISLAAPTTFKFHRKKSLLAIANNEIYIPEVKYRFGSSMADDFLALYFCWKFGKKWVQDNYSPNLPDDIPNVDMSFVEKVNTENMLHIDKEFREILLNNISSFGIEFFNANDYTNLSLVNQYLFK